MLVVRGQRQDDMIDARASAACTTAAARGGAYWPWRGPTGIGWRFPRLCESHEFAVFRQAASIMVIDTVGRGEACNIHHLKGFGICVEHNRSEIDAGRDSGRNPVGVESAGATLFPVIRELYGEQMADHRDSFGGYTSARTDRKTLLTNAENGRSLPLTVTNAGRIESKSFRLRHASAIATGKSDESQSVTSAPSSI